MSNIKVYSDLELTSSLSFSKNYTDFPIDPSPRTIIVKDGVAYIYSELVNSSGFFSWQPISNKQASFLHTQGVASTIWTVTHNFNSNDFAYFVYDANHRLVVANIEIVDLNTVRILLSEAMTGTVVLFSLQYISATTAVTQELKLGNIVLTDTSNQLTVDGNQVALKSYVDSQLATFTPISSYNDLSNKPTLFSGSYTDLLDKPVMFSGSYTDLSNKPTLFSGSYTDLLDKPIIPSKTSDLTNDSQFQRLSDVTTAIENVVGAAPAALDTLVEIATQLANDESAAAALVTVVSTKASSADVNTALELKANSSSLATVATSGSYNDLTNKPIQYTLPTATTSVLGGVKVDGTSIMITDGVISSAGGVPSTITSGSNALAASTTCMTLSNGYNTTVGDSVVKNYILYGTTTSNIETEIFLVGGSRIPVNNNTTVFYTIDVVGRRTDVSNEHIGTMVKGIAANNAGSTYDVGSLYEVIVARSTLDLLVDARVNSSTNTLNIYVTGGQSKTIKWVAHVQIIEVSQ